MRIIIGGAGEVGRGVAKALYNEGQDVVLIDSDPAAIKEAQSIDAFVLLGDVSRREILKEAGIRDAQVFICLLYTSPSPRDATLSRMPSSA